MSPIDQETSDTNLGRTFLGLVFFWSLVLVALGAWSYRQAYTAELDAARAAASESFRKDVIFRSWASMHGGVYVPVTADTPPNPNMSDVPERDISTPSGRHLTLMNPAYMTRQVHELGNRDNGSKGHITSLNPIRPKNAADEWETRALQAFEKGAKEISSVEQMGGESYFRFMKPLTVEQGCLDCHAKQNYKLGDIRGGISASILWAPYDAAIRSQVLGDLAGYGAIWAIGLLGLRLGRKRLEADLAERRRSEQALHEGARELRLFADNVPAMTISFDRNLECLFANRRYAEFFGFDAISIVGKHLREIVGERAYKEVEGYFDQVLRGKEVSYQRTRILADAEPRYLEIKVIPRIGDDETVVGCFAVATNITEFKKTEQALRDSVEKLDLAASVFTHAREAIAIADADANFIEVNEAFTRITGFGRDEVLGRNPKILKSGRQGPEFYAAMWRELNEKGHWAGEIWNRRKSGQEYAEMLTISAIRDAQGNTRQYVALFSDITPIKEHQQQLENIAHYDALTTLPNRVLLADRLKQALAQAQRRGQQLAVVFLDLDGFKAINDNHGHDAGDMLLVAVAARMKAVLREGDTLARLGGDEFVAILLDLADRQTGESVLTRLLEAAARPVHVGNLFLQVSASLGVTFYPQSEDVDADQLLRQADQAMYQAKLSGKNRYHVFDAEQDRSVRGRHESLERIRQALGDREFVLYYQPKVNMRTGSVEGAEALIRWQHPERGLLPPEVFLPVIEDHPLAVEIGEWVIESTLVQMERWQEAGVNIPVSVNVGARQLQQDTFVERLRKMLDAHPKVKPDKLEMEVLETSALEDVNRVSEVMQTCRKMGVRFALDDFGTGYSSLTYLKRLPVTLLKIDQSFVRDMLDDPDDLAILQGVLGLASAFRREVIAEGVETMEHGTLLLHLGCELAQGYGIARPMPADKIPAWSVAWKTYPEWYELTAAHSDDLPLLFASVEHRAWVRAIEEHLKGEREIPPPLDHHQCRLGIWLDSEGEVRYRAQPAFKTMEHLHRQVHVLVAEMCELQSQGMTPDALAKLGELQGLRDSLLLELRTLEKDIRK